MGVLQSMHFILSNATFVLEKYMNGNAVSIQFLWYAAAQTHRLP